jgi:hypothetical protein
MEEHDAIDDTIASLRREKAKSLATDLVDDCLVAANTSDLVRLLGSQARCHRGGGGRDRPIQPPTTRGP